MNIYFRKIGVPLFPEGFAKTETPAGCLDIIWLGQAGFIMRSETCSVVIDPYLSDTLSRKYKNGIFPHIRMMPPPVSPEELSECGIDIMLVTHAHTDHMDPGTLCPVYASGRKKQPLCLAPRAEGENVLKRGVPVGRLALLDKGESLSLGRALGAVKITAHASAHEEQTEDAAGNSKYLGYIVDFGGIRVYHSGDGVPYPGLVEQISEFQIDIALLPVNGRDTFRSSHGIPGNFTIDEAFSLVSGAGIPFLIPHHFNMFAFNTADPEQIVSVLDSHGLIEKQDYILPSPGCMYRFSGSDR